MIDKRKLITMFNTFIMSISSSYALTVIENTQPVQQNEGAQTIAMVILGGFAFLIIAVVTIGIVVAVLMKVYNMLTEYKRKKSDFMYGMFKQDVNQCHISRDPLMKRRLKRTLGIFWRRNEVYYRTSDGEYKVLGLYDGECMKKENYYCIALYNKLGMFTMFDQIILLPMSIKDKIYAKTQINGKTAIILECEGIDQIENTDYYFLPLLQDPNRENEFIDFADKIHKEYFEKTVYRDVIKEQLQSYRENIIDSVEANPHVQFRRRGQG